MPDIMPLQARLTKLVANAESRDELPYIRISPGDYTSVRRKPDLAELNTAAALSQLASAMEASSWEFRHTTTHHDIPPAAGAARQVVGLAARGARPYARVARLYAQGHLQDDHRRRCRG